MGLLAALAFAWRGAGTIAVVAMLLTAFGYSFGVASADRIGRMDSFHYRRSNKQEFSDLNLVLDVGGCNVIGAELRANGVVLGKTPVRITLAEFLAKVPDWKKAPEPTLRTDSTVASDIEAAESMPEDPHWGTLRLPELPFVRLPEAIENTIRERKGRYIYFQCEYDGELGVSGGSSGFGGGGENYSGTITFRFPKRDAAIERLLNQARLADYKVNEEWLKAAAAFGPDAWIATWMTTPYEPEMNQMLDAWARWQYDLDDVHSATDAWQALERVRGEADRDGRYVTSSPAGHAVEILSTRLDPWELIEAADSLINSISSVAYGHGSDGRGLSYWSVESEGGRGLQIPLTGNGMSVSSGNEGRLQPSGLALAHAIWLSNRRMINSQSSNDSETPYQQRLAPSLLKADLNRRPPYALMGATHFGGATIEKFLMRKASLTQDATWQSNFLDFEYIQGVHVNRWLYYAAQLPGPVGRKFRRANEDALFNTADQISAVLFGMRENVADKLPFLFVENDLGPASIGRKYWPRFRAIAERQAPSALDNELGYLVALGSAADPQMYVDAVASAWKRNREQHMMIEFISWRLSEIQREQRAAILDGIISSLVEDARPASSTDWQRAYAIRGLREARYLEIDDAESVAYLLKWFCGELPKDEQPGLSLKWFESEKLPKTAARRPLLIAALAAAPEAKFRLLAVKAMEAQPIPRFQQLASQLLQDPDEQVRAAAQGAEEHWESLR